MQNLLNLVKSGARDSKREGYAKVLKLIKEDKDDFKPQVHGFVEVFLSDIQDNGDWAPRAFSCLGYFSRHHELVAAMDVREVVAIFDAMAHVLEHTPSKKHHSFAVWILGVQKFISCSEVGHADIVLQHAAAMKALVDSVCGPYTKNGLRPMALASVDSRWKTEDAHKLHSEILSTLLSLVETNHRLMADCAHTWLPYTLELLLDPSVDHDKPLRSQAASVLDRIVPVVKPPQTPEALVEEISRRMTGLYADRIHRMTSKASPACAKQGMHMLGLCALLHTALQQRHSQQELNSFLALAERGLVHPLEDVRTAAMDAWRRLICNLGRVRKTQMAELLMKPLMAAPALGPGAKSGVPQAAVYSAWCTLANIAAAADDAYCVAVMAQFLAVVEGAQDARLQSQLLAFVAALLQPGGKGTDDGLTPTQTQHVDAEGLPCLAVRPRPAGLAATPRLVPALANFFASLAPRCVTAAGPVWEAICYWAAAAGTPERGAQFAPALIAAALPFSCTEANPDARLATCPGPAQVAAQCVTAYATAFGYPALLEPCAEPCLVSVPGIADAGRPWVPLKALLRAYVCNYVQSLGVAKPRARTAATDTCCDVFCDTVTQVCHGILAVPSKMANQMADVFWMSDVVAESGAAAAVVWREAVLRLWSCVVAAVHKAIAGHVADAARAPILRSLLAKPKNLQPLVQLLVMPLRNAVRDTGAGLRARAAARVAPQAYAVPALRCFLGHSDFGAYGAAPWTDLWYAVAGALQEPQDELSWTATLRNFALEVAWCEAAIGLLEGSWGGAAEPATSSTAADADDNVPALEGLGALPRVVDAVRTAAFMLHCLIGCAVPPGADREAQSAAAMPDKVASVLVPCGPDPEESYAAALTAPDREPANPLLLRLGAALGALQGRFVRVFAQVHPGSQSEADVDEAAFAIIQCLEFMLRCA